MTSYASSGVDIEAGDECSSIAYSYAKATFSSRDNMIGKPVVLEGGFAGLLDMGDFYMVQNDDGVGTKIIIADMINKFDTLGTDLLAMICDDAVCLGAETFSLSNTMDVSKVHKEDTDILMKSLSEACIEHKIVIPGGEIAELGKLVNGKIWNATGVGVVEKDKVITGDKVKSGDVMIGLAGNVLRSNGFSLVRQILNDKYGYNWGDQAFDENSSWGEVLLTPSKIYSSFVLSLIGRFKKERKVDVHGIVHMTGGGVYNLFRIVKGKGLGFEINNTLAPHEAILKLQEIGNVSDEEAYKVWHMGMGMVLIVDESDVDFILDAAKDSDMTAAVVGRISSDIPDEINIKSEGFFKKGEILNFKK